MVSWGEDALAVTGRRDDAYFWGMACGRENSGSSTHSSGSPRVQLRLVLCSSKGIFHWAWVAVRELRGQKGPGPFPACASAWFGCHFTPWGPTPSL